MFTAYHFCGLVHHAGCFAQRLSYLECNRQTTFRKAIPRPRCFREVTSITVLQGSVKSDLLHDSLRITYYANIIPHGGYRIFCSNQRLQVHRHICLFSGIRKTPVGWPMVSYQGDVIEEAPLVVVEVSDPPSAKVHSIKFW